jgi:hypothetical protein
VILSPRGLIKVYDLLKHLDMVNDNRQEKKVRHKMGDIIALAFFATLANMDDWVSVEVFGKEHEGFLRKYMELSAGIPSHDTGMFRRKE